MSNPSVKTNARKLLLLVVMLMFLAALSLGNAVKPAVANNEPLICCSACEGDNPPLACRHGCSPSCNK